MYAECLTYYFCLASFIYDYGEPPYARFPLIYFVRWITTIYYQRHFLYAAICSLCHPKRLRHANISASIFLILTPPHHPLPHAPINNPPNAKSRDHPRHTRKTAAEPIPADTSHSFSPSHPRSIIEIQPPQVQRRAQKLYPCRREKLRRTGS